MRTHLAYYIYFPDHGMRRFRKRGDSVNATRTLLPQHLKDLRCSGLSDEQIARCGFYSEVDPAKWSNLLNWKSAPKNAGAVLCIPFSGVDGAPLGYVRVKPDK